MSDTDYWGSYAGRFVDSYHKYPPEYLHGSVIVCNGAAPTNDDKCLFASLPEVKFIEHDNVGYDIGGFQLAARTIPCDLIIFLGSYVHFWKPGWLKRIAETYLEHGFGMYGPWGIYHPKPHIRTTSFWMPPQLMNHFPYIVTNQTRYESEHGNTSFTLWCQKIGIPTNQVTWNKVLDREHWESVERNECLMLDQHTERLGWQ